MVLNNTANNTNTIAALMQDTNAYCIKNNADFHI